MALDVPKSDHADARRGHQYEAEVRIVQERECEPEVLANVYQGHGCVYGLGGVPRHVSVTEPCWERNATHIGEKKVGEQVNESVRQLSILLQGGPELSEIKRERSQEMQVQTCFHPIVK
jgi:hypothetical protein